MTFKELPASLRPRREKLFGDGRPRPLDRNAKARVMVLARALMRPTEAGKHYGAITAKAYAVLEALLWAFHNAKSGLCFPSYESIADKAGCHRDTVAEAIKALEAAGVLSWVNRIKRIGEISPDMFGQRIRKTRVVRTSNGYQFHDPQPSKVPTSVAVLSKSENASGTSIQELIPLTAPAITAKFTDPELGALMARWGKHTGALA
jgi:hypothetical protein